MRVEPQMGTRHLWARRRQQRTRQTRFPPSVEGDDYMQTEWKGQRGAKRSADWCDRSPCLVHPLTLHNKTHQAGGFSNRIIFSHCSGS